MQHNTIWYNNTMQYNLIRQRVKHFYLTIVKYSNHITHCILYYHITAFGGTRDLQGLQGMGVHSIFRSPARPAPEPKFIIWSSHPQIYLPDLTSSFFLASIPSFPILPSSRFLRYTPTIASSSPHHPFSPSLIFQYLPPPSPIPPTYLISSFNSLYFAYFLPASLPSHAIKPNPRFIFGPFGIVFWQCNANFKPTFCFFTLIFDWHP